MMKAMKQMKNFLTMLALTMVGPLMISCSSSDETTAPVGPQPKSDNYSVTQTVTISLDGEAATRSLDPTTGAKTFVEGDQVALIYKSSSTNQLVKVVSAALTNTEITDGGKEANYSFTLTDTPVSDSKVRYIYPAAMAAASMPADADADNDGTVNYDALNSQNGTAASLNNIDLAICDATLNGTTLPDNKPLKNQLAIIELNILNKEGVIFNYHIHKISLNVAGGRSYNIVPTDGKAFPNGSIYVGMLPISNKNVEFAISINTTAYNQQNNYAPSATNKTLERNKIYPINFTLNFDDGNACTPLTFEAYEAGASVTFTLAEGVTGNVIYSTDSGATWSDYTSGTEISLASVGDRVMFRGNNASYYNDPNYSHFVTSKCYIYGNVISLINSTIYGWGRVLTGNHNFDHLFYNNQDMKSHPTNSLRLSATFTPYCYEAMFSGCSSITTPPYMYNSEVNTGCFKEMFKGCTSLTESPYLPATSLNTDCYKEMFYGCYNLSTVICLAKTNKDYGCTNWLYDAGRDVTGVKTFYKNSTTTWGDSSPSTIPEGWTVANYK